MNSLLRMLEDMALNGYGVAWHNVHKEYRPFAVISNDKISDGLEWWHDPDGCGNVDFQAAVEATHEEMLRQLGP